MESGKYAYDFGGKAINNGQEFQVVGVGSMNLTSKGNISGFHTSSATSLSALDATIRVRHFTLVGSYGPRKDGFGDDDIEATITFTSVEQTNGKPEQILKGTFSMVAAGNDRFLIISTGAFNETTGLPADEVVKGEAIKIAS